MGNCGRNLHSFVSSLVQHLFVFNGFQHLFVTSGVQHLFVSSGVQHLFVSSCVQYLFASSALGNIQLKCLYGKGNKNQKQPSTKWTEYHGEQLLIMIACEVQHPLV